jgi:peptide/nickel transport system substrate-binding protein
MAITRTVRASATGAALLLLLAGCGGKGDDKAAGDRSAGDKATGGPTASATPSTAARAVKALEFAVDDKAVGPAPAVPGAVSGGTIKVIDLDDLAHLDPARIYVSSYQNASQMITRALTGYRQQEGKVTLVGDLATDTGRTDDGGKTWTFTLRDGITYEDGSAIVAADIKYGLERAFVSEYSEGPTYIQEWLADGTDFRKFYKGPYDGKSLPNVEVPDAKTIVFKFAKAHPDLPFAAALPMSAPVKKSKDTRAKYDRMPFASGPYKVAEHKADKTLVLVRNDKWNADSDPIRTQYVDSYAFEFGTQPLAINQRLVAANGDDARAITMVTNVSPELLSVVGADPDLKARTISGDTLFVSQYNINNSRITDLEVRKALLFAFPKQQVRQITGGPERGEFATTVSSPALVGHENDDVWKVPPAGDPKRAKEILTKAGKVGQKIVYAYGATDRGEQISVKVVSALEEAGFTVVKKPINSTTFIDETAKVDNAYDLYANGWGADWPSGSTVYPPTLDGRRIFDGSPNYSHFNDPEINREMDRISAITDPIEAGREWAALDRRIMAKVPYIPYLYGRDYQLFGPRIGGAFLDTIFGLISLNGLYVKP